MENESDLTLDKLSKAGRPAGRSGDRPRGTCTAAGSEPVSKVHSQGPLSETDKSRSALAAAKRTLPARTRSDEVDEERGSQAQVGEAWVIVRPPPKGPTIFSIGFVDR